MIMIGDFEAKNRLAELLGRAASGESIVITKQGTPMAILGPATASLTVEKSGGGDCHRESWTGQDLWGVFGARIN